MFIDQGDLERRMGAETFVQCTDDDNDGVADATVVSELCDDVDAVVRSLLIGKGWTPDQITKLESDKAIRRLAAWIGADLTAERRQQFRNPDGSTQYTDRARDARADIQKYATGELRSIAEPQAGKNANLGSQKSNKTPKYYFTSDPRDPNDRGPGGF
jgi:hypothetical protein